VLGFSYLQVDGNVNFHPFTSVALAKRNLLNNIIVQNFRFFDLHLNSKSFSRKVRLLTSNGSLIYRGPMYI